jgi:hypothetical protein
MFDHIEERYAKDVIFRRVVDQMRSLLEQYHITPSELREASILAATMHETINIRPILYYDKDYTSWVSYLRPPVMFGEGNTASTAKGNTVSTATGAALNTTSTATAEEVDKSYGKHYFVFQGDFLRCERCNLSDVYVKKFKVACTGLNDLPF